MIHMNDYYVYFLINSLDNKVFYIGKGKRNRMYKHELLVNKGIKPNNNPILYNKILKIKKCGGYIIYEKILTNLTEHDAFNLEIQKISEIGLENLCNLHCGGRGGDNPYSRTLEAKEKRASKMRGRNLSAEHRKSISETQKGVPKHSEQYKKFLSIRMSGKNNPMFGKTISKENKEIISKANKGKKLSKETKAKISKFQKNRIRSETECNNISLAKIKYFKKIKEQGIEIKISDESKRKSSITKLGGFYTFTKNNHIINPISINQFRKENKIPQRKMIKLLKGEIISYNGWTVQFTPVP
jgi:LEM3-like protein/NUMOD3 motif-containing protein